MQSFEFMTKYPITRSFRAAKVEGMFDVPSRDEQTYGMKGEIDLSSDWQIGCITGASGAGKTLLARHLFGDDYYGGHKWSAPCMLDDFPDELEVTEIIKALTAVGFSSPPAWLKSYKVLSTGQKFRADLAYALVTGKEITVYDEFTSVVDRNVAKAASVAVNKYIGKSNKKFVAVTCHDDIIEWLEPDWIYNVDEMCQHWRSLRRPEIKLSIYQGDSAAWTRFRGNHYMNDQLNKTARIFLAYIIINGVERLVGFFSVIPVLGMRGWRRGHRTVVLPDFQGMGIGNAMIETVAEELWEREKLRFRATTSSPALVNHRRRRPEVWKLVQGPAMKGRHGNPKYANIPCSAGRLTTSWEYIPRELRT